MTPRRAVALDAPALARIQSEAYARNRAFLGVEPLPLLVEARDVIAGKETWIVAEAGDLVSALALETLPDALLIWSVATRPDAQGRGHGRRWLAFAERLARERGLSCIVLYTGEKLPHNVAWYARYGYHVDRVETLPDRRVVHMSKTL